MLPTMALISTSCLVDSDAFVCRHGFGLFIATPFSGRSCPTREVTLFVFIFIFPKVEGK